MTIELVWDKSDCSLDIGNLRIQAAPKNYPPFSCQAIVEEQDTYLILGEQTELKDPGKPAWYLANTMENTETYSLGSVVIKGKSPLRLCAVVHDIEQEPTYTHACVGKAYQAVMQTVQKRNITSLALPLLGSIHGKLSVTESVQLLDASVIHGYPENLEKLWLILPSGSNCDCLKQLQQKQK
jgi:hypothetical protein